MLSRVRAACVIAASVALLVLPTRPAAYDGTKATASVTIAAVGDTMLGDTPDLPPHPGEYLEAVQPILDRSAQIVFGNLEGCGQTRPLRALAGGEAA